MPANKKAICFVCWGKTGEILINRDYLLHEYFAKVFDNLILLDVSNVFSTSLIHGGSAIGDTSKLSSKFKIVSPKSLSECQDFLKSDDMVVIHYFSQRWYDWWLYYYLRKYSIPLVYIQTQATVVSFHFNESQRRGILRRYLTRWKEAIPAKFLRFCMSRGFVSKVDTYYLSRRDKAEGKKVDPRYNEVVLVNSRSYDNLLEKNLEISNDYIVFLDSMLPYHLDQLRCGYPSWTDLERRLYYENLCRVLDTAASEMKKELVICLHPSYDERYLDRDFGGRRAVKYKTDEFVAKAETVFFHESSSVNNAIVYGKKVVQLIGSDFNNFAKDNCQAYQKIIPFTTIDMYECTEDSIRETLRTMELNRERYETFLSNHIIASGGKGVRSCEQIADHISRKYGITKKG